MLTSEEIKQIGQEVARVIEDNINPQFETLRTDIQEIRGDIKDIRSTMVTKDYLDEKLAQQKQLRSLVDLLQAKQVISSDEAKRLFIIDPFPQAS
ncbi:hypothetical protein HZA86_02260 [Candidatus Uhrbacteria bacterium]|nr:hypothetical protein [Candidatus Uhrbacteria bacterium]